MSNETQKIRDYIKEHQKKIEENLVSAFQFDINRFEEILQEANITPPWSDDIAKDLKIKKFVRFSTTRWSGEQILKAYRGFLKCLESNEVIEQAISYFESVLPRSPDDSGENSEGETEWDQYNDTFAGERFNKTRRFTEIAAILNDRTPTSALCTKNKETKKKRIEECDLHIDTIGMGQDVRQFDSRTGKVLYVIAMLEDVKSSALDVGKGNEWRTTMENLGEKIDSFFNDIGTDVLETKPLDAVDVTSKIKAALRDMVEDPKVKDRVDLLVDSLVFFQKKHTLTTMFLQNKVTRKRSDRDVLSSVARMSTRIKKLQNAMLANTLSDCEIAAGAIHLGIITCPKIKEQDKVPFKIVATSERSRTVLKNIGAL